MPLAGLRVLELGQLIAGPFACALLAGSGADVIEVEPPGTGPGHGRAPSQRRPDPGRTP